MRLSGSAIPTSRTVVVGVDFSRNASHASAWAMAYAKAIHARLVFVHAIDVPTTSTVPLAVEEDTTRRLRRLEREAAAKGIDAGVLSRVGQPCAVIAHAAVSLGASLIVLGIRGQNAIGRFFLGSTTDRVLRSSTTPVVAVHPNDPIPEFPVTRVVVATDFSPTADEAVRCGKTLLRASGARGRMTLVHACVTPLAYEPYSVNGMLPTILAETERSAKESMQRVIAQQKLANESFAVDSVVREAYAPNLIVEAADEREVDVIVLGTAGRSGLDRLLLGSTAERVLHSAHCAVYVVHKVPAATDAIAI